MFDIVTDSGLKLKQYQIDTWTTREQLCLASAVMRSGDQNWVAVRRNIKMLTNEKGRPPDWYSTKNCALQYAKLLECVDTPKRKRERGDGANETPGEIVTKMLSRQRVEELQALEAEERAAYNQLRHEINQLEAGLLDHQLDGFWEQLVKERAEEEEEELRHQQWLKEREEKITAIQWALKHQGPKVPMPPNKKKQKLHMGGSGGQAASHRNSGPSETSSEVDSAVDSPDLIEAASESLSQDEGVSQESETKTTPTSPLLSSLLSQSPITNVPIPSVPGSSSSLNPMGLGSRGIRGIGISPVSEALQNLVSSAISGTDTVDKDKSSHSAAGAGSSTLSLLLDLPPSTPGGPLPRLSDLSGPAYDRREQEKRLDIRKTFEKETENDAETKACKEEEISTEKTLNRESERTDEKVSAIMAVEGEDGGEGEEIKEETQMEENKGTAEEIMEEVDKLEIGKSEIKDMETEDIKETNHQKENLEGKHGELKVKEKDPQDAVGIDVGILKIDMKKMNEKKEDIIGAEDKKSLEDKCLEAVEIMKEKKEKEDDSVKNFEEITLFKNDDKEIKEENLSMCELAKEEDCKKPEYDFEKFEEDKQSEIGDDVINFMKKPDVEEYFDKKEKSSEEESSVKIKRSEDSEQDMEMEKFKKSHKKEDEDDHHESQDSKDWASEEEGSFAESRKRKISGGELGGCSSPVISESAPNSPASTHYGDDSESERAYRSWKKPIMILWNEIAAHKFASIFLRPITDDQAPGYHSVVYRSMDLQKVKRNIESGITRTTGEFQRDIMLMFLNAKMYNTSDHDVYHMADQMMYDAIATIEEFLNTQMLARAEETPQKSLRRETRESSAKRSDDDLKRKRDSLEDKNIKKRRLV
ncbi:uncharacterized protein [Panulirus ornatus]|uniref:uncharacterized protein isoform X3 n=1 Tax=Panulirus ornatus TaxID=150431 RepID=UPI003A83E619